MINIARGKEKLNYEGSCQMFLVSFCELKLLESSYVNEDHWIERKFLEWDNVVNGFI